MKTINEFNFFCLWSKKIIKKMKKRYKSKFLYLPFGFDSLSISRFNKVSKKIKEEEINFVGTFDENRLNILKSIKTKKKNLWWKLD